MTTILFHTTTLLTLVILLTPLLLKPNTKTITTTVKAACMVSLLPMLLLIDSGTQTITTNVTWAQMTFNLTLSFMFDYYSTMFLPIALLITWSIMEFSNWYMASDPNLHKFSKYLLIFLIAMLILTTANNMLQLFIGWEGVGIMSFLLISWWHGRASATTSALQAIIYNRIGDVGLILSMSWIAVHHNTWELHQMYSHQDTPTLPLLGLILAAAGKSAQFGLHPWLPAAMEGPTPVSALLHSSTMVVAGVFLLIRMHPMIQSNEVATSTCICLGALTTTFAALCALTQNDIKKIIAFSTLSQLGLMVLTIGLNQPELAFLHISTHAFFKAMLFLCSGSLIHALNNEQDIRKMGGMQKAMPITTTAMTLGSLALAGTPFLAGFYSKDIIIETMTNSALNAWALTMTMMATTLTAAYSLRLVFYLQMGTPRYPAQMQPTETHQNQTTPILRLAVGSILAGLIISSTMIPKQLQPTTMPPTVKLLALMATLAGLLVALDLVSQMHPTPPSYTKIYTKLSNFIYFNLIMHRTWSLKLLMLANAIMQLNDRMLYEAIGPELIKKLNTLMSTKASAMQSGLVKAYLAAMLLMPLFVLSWTLWHT
uniref:NADH-ubiquinone oxidoreductase chain 5 n=1 Tax=Tarentola mauritanica TaxID=8569 RepID=H9CXL2_TARMA|nr:NADH dehydrogenase subunit 5 [Tarentola mauritanica]